MTHRRLSVVAAAISLVLTLPAAGAGTARAQGSLPAVIPIFPLPDATLFPNATHAFHVFEPRYRSMIADALKGDRIIGMTTLRPGYEADYEGRPPVFPVGCAGLITDYEELPDGRINIVLGGLVKFRVQSEDDSRPYRLARVTVIPEGMDERTEAALRKMRQRLVDLLAAVGDRAAVGEPPPGMPDEQVVDTLSQYLPMNPLERQWLLEQDGPLARAGVLVDVLERMLPATQVRVDAQAASSTAAR